MTFVLRRALLARAAMGGHVPYWRKIINTIGSAYVLRYWPLWDAGTTVEDISTTGDDGAYIGTPTLQQSGVEPGGESVKFVAGSGANVFTAALSAAFTPQEVTISAWFKAPDAAFWENDTVGQIVYTKASGITLGLSKNSSNSIAFSMIYGGTSKGLVSTLKPTTWTHLTTTVNTVADRASFYINGSQYSVSSTKLGVPGGSIDRFLVGCYSTAASYPALGWVSHVFVASRELSSEEVATIAQYPFSVRARYFAIGDSKTNTLPSWTTYVGSIATGLNAGVVGLPRVYSGGGWTASDVAGTIDAALAERSETPDYVIVNLGANDVNAGVPGAQWQIDMAYIAAACYTKWPDVTVYLTKIWRRDKAAEIAALNTMIDTLAATYSYISVGINEADYLPGDDDGVTYTSDGIHPNDAGNALLAQAWLTHLGLV